MFELLQPSDGFGDLCGKLCPNSSNLELLFSCSLKTVVVSLWNELATKTAEELLNLLANKESPIVAIKALKVSDYQGVCLL